MATQYSNKPIVTDGLVYALDFGNPKSYVSGSSTAQSLIYRPAPAKFEALLPGDYGTPAAAYSVRKVVSSYTGSAMQVQSASATLDIGFDADGNLDTASLASFAGSGDAFVKIWYDQSGNNNHATQSVTTSQPKIYSGSQGSIILENGKPVLHFNEDSINTSNFLTSDLVNRGLSVFTVFRHVSQVGGPFNVDFIYTVGKGTGNNRLLELMTIGPTGTPQYYNSVIQFGLPTLTSSFTTGQKLFTQIGGNTSSSFFENSNTAGIATSVTFPAQTDPPHPLYLGSFSGGYRGNFRLQEFILYNVQQFNNRTYIENNINSYYNIFTTTSDTLPTFNSGFLNFTSPDTLKTQQTFPGFSYDQGNSTVMYVGETKGDSTVFTQDGTLSIVSTTSSVGFGSPENLFGRSYPASGLKHVTLRFSSGSTDCFINGVPVSASAVLPSGSSIGGGQLNIPLYTGSLGGFQVYNRPLTSDEIYNNYLIAARRYSLPDNPKPYTLDENAYLFLQSAGITDPIITSSIDTFVRGLKTNNLWDKMIAIYPFVGTGSDGVNLTGSQLWNLKEPSLVTYPLTFTGSWIGSTSGSAPSGSNTNISVNGLTPSQYYPSFNTQSAHISILSYDTPASSSYLMGTGMTEELALSTLAGDYGTPAAAYSVRKVRTAYSGALMDVRRNYDNVTSSIGYVETGDLDTGSLLDFVIAGRNDLPGEYEGLAAAYSLRKVSSSYDGPAVDVRRIWDNTTSSIGFDSNGNLDTESLLHFTTSGSNSFSYSNNFNAGWVIVSSQITSSAVLGPYGLGSGSFINETSTNDIHGINVYFNFESTAVLHTISGFVKKQERRYVGLGFAYNSGNGITTIFDLDTTSSVSSGSIGAGYTVVSSSINYVTDGWFRISLTGTTGHPQDFVPRFFLATSSAQINANGAYYVGEPGTGSYIYGFQHTTGSTLQPYIETTGTALYNVGNTSSFGYVNTWYDQSGNGRHATQTTASYQPLIVSSGSLITENGKPALSFNGNNRLISPTFTTITHPVTTFVAYKYTSTTNNSYGFVHALSSNSGWLSRNTSINISSGQTLFSNIVAANNTPYLTYALFNETNSEIKVNNTLVTGSSGTENRVYNRVTLGDGYGNNFNGAYAMQGTISEFILYSGSQSSNRPLIENNINNYYNIYTGSNHGFVERWYDQSGNNNHANQSVTSSQPLIVLSGSVITDNSTIGIYFNNTTFLQRGAINVTQAGQYTVYTPYGDNTYDVWGQPSGDAYWRFGNGNGYIDLFGGTNTTNNRRELYPTGVPSSGPTLFSSFHEGNNMTTFINNSNRGTNSTQPFDSTGIVYIGSQKAGANYSLSGSIKEIIVYNSANTSNREPIEYGINDYYNIYPQTSSFTTSSFTIKADSTTISGSLNNKLTSGIQSSGPLGLVTVSRTGSDSLTIARNGATTSFSVPASGALSTGLYLGAINSGGTALGNSPLNLSFASVGTGLTNSETGVLGAEVTYFKALLNSHKYTPELLTILNKANSEGITVPSPSELEIQNQFIQDLKAGLVNGTNVWDSLDMLRLFANSNENMTLIDYKNPTTVPIGEFVGSPTFTQNVGLAGNGATSTYYQTNFTPSIHAVNMVVRNGHLGYYRTSETTLGATGGSSYHNSGLYSNSTVKDSVNIAPDNQFTFALQNPTNNARTVNLGEQPINVLVSVKRGGDVSPNYFYGYIDTTQKSNDSPTVAALPTAPYRALYGRNDNNAMIFSGASLTFAQMADLKAAIEAYLAAISS